MFVAFKKPPAKAVAAAIVRRVPPPLRDTIEWNGRVLWVASEQGVGRTIAATYGKQKKEELTTRSQFKVAPSSAYGRFNADIDAWLEFTNNKSPILVAMRAEDEEAGGTVLSEWHHMSVTALPKVVADLARDDDGHAARLGVRLVDFAKAARVKVDASVAKTSHVGRRKPRRRKQTRRPTGTRSPPPQRRRLVRRLRATASSAALALAFSQHEKVSVRMASQ